MLQTIPLRRLATLLCLTGSLSAAPLIAQADDTVAQPGDKTDETSKDALAPPSDSPQEHLRIGLSAGIARKPYEGSDTNAKLMPMLGYENKWLRVMGPGVEGKLAHIGALSFGVKTIWSFQDGYKSSDADIFNGMQTRKGSVWLGPSMEWRTGVGMLAAEVLTDASGHSNGQQAKLSFGTRFHAGDLEYGPHLSLQWQSDRYVDYYYGVNDSESTASRAAYTGRATLNASVGLQLNYHLSRQQSLGAEIGVEHYGKGITDSPLVNKSTTPILRLGYTYFFNAF
jgi:outer membrane protein